MDYSGKAISWCRRLGWPAGSVYRPWNEHTRVAKDFIETIDVIAYDAQPGVLGIQATGKQGEAAKHITKLREVVSSWPERLSQRRKKKNGEREWGQLPELHPLLLHLAAGNRFQIWAFRKVKVKRGGKQEVWRPRILSLSISSLTSSEPPEPSSLEIDTPLPPSLRVRTPKEAT